MTTTDPNDRPNAPANSPKPGAGKQVIPFSVIMELYGEVNDTQRYEGEGIWNRFNILVTLHMVLFGVVSFIYSQLPEQRTIVGVLSVSGAILAAWGFYVLRRLWLWHAHWKDNLRKLEQFFPRGLPRPFADRPPHLVKSTAWYQTWLLAYTQPFMLVLLFTWVSLVTMIVAGIEPHSSTKSTETKQNDPPRVGVSDSNDTQRPNTAPTPR
jgi:hypothetical protein